MLTIKEVVLSPGQIIILLLHLLRVTLQMVIILSTIPKIVLLTGPTIHRIHTILTATINTVRGLIPLRVVIRHQIGLIMTKDIRGAVITMIAQIKEVTGDTQTILHGMIMDGEAHHTIILDCLREWVQVRPLAILTEVQVEVLLTRILSQSLLVKNVSQLRGTMDNV